MSKLKVRIVNPVRAGCDVTSAARARRFVHQGRAVFVDDHTIRFIEADPRHGAAVTMATYDAWGRDLNRMGGKLDWRGARPVNVSALRGGFRPGEVRS